MVGKIAIGVMLGLFLTCVVCCVAGSIAMNLVFGPKPAVKQQVRKSPRTVRSSFQPKAQPQAEVTNVWVERNLLKISWKNTGSVPIDKMSADIMLYDQSGEILKGSAEQYTIFIATTMRPAVRPGETYYPPIGSGYAITGASAYNLATYWVGNLEPVSYASTR